MRVFLQNLRCAYIQSWEALQSWEVFRFHKDETESKFKGFLQMLKSTHLQSWEVLQSWKVFRKSQSGVKKLGAFRIKVQRFSSDAKKSSHAKLRDVQKTWKPYPQNGKNSQQKFRDFLQMPNCAHKLSWEVLEVHLWEKLGGFPKFRGTHNEFRESLKFFRRHSS